MCHIQSRGGLHPVPGEPQEGRHLQLHHLGGGWGLPPPLLPAPLLGATIGRLLGETVALLFPRGLRSEGDPHPVIPGGYALAGELVGRRDTHGWRTPTTHTLTSPLLPGSPRQAQLPFRAQ